MKVRWRPDPELVDAADRAPWDAFGASALRRVNYATQVRTGLSGGLMFALGAMAALLYSPQAHHGRTAVVVAGVGALLASVFLLGLLLTLDPRRLLRAYPIAALTTLPAGGVLTSLALAGTGDTMQVIAILYAEAPLLGFYMFHRRPASVLVALVAIEYACVLAWQEVPFERALAQWFVVASTVTAIGVLIGGWAARVDQLAESARAARAELAVMNSDLEGRVAEQVQEIRESRARIVEASDESRRRIERNIHDGAQQQLAALSLDLRMLAADAAGLSPSEVRTQLEAAHANLKTALEDLRELARGLHPTVLTTDGLEGALDLLAARASVPTSVMVPEGRFPEHIETAAYFVAAEALTNVVKYADASTIEIRVARVNGTLEISVSDNGSGGASLTPGGGLVGLSDRVAAVGGTLGVISPLGAGTTVTATLPLQSGSQTTLNRESQPWAY